MDHLTIVGIALAAGGIALALILEWRREGKL